MLPDAMLPPRRCRHAFRYDSHCHAVAAEPLLRYAMAALLPLFTTAACCATPLLPDTYAAYAALPPRDTLPYCRRRYAEMPPFRHYADVARLIRYAAADTTDRHDLR